MCNLLASQVRKGYSELYLDSNHCRRDCAAVELPPFITAQEFSMVTT